MGSRRLALVGIPVGLVRPFLAPFWPYRAAAGWAISGIAKSRSMASRSATGSRRNRHTPIARRSSRATGSTAAAPSLIPGTVPRMGRSWPPAGAS